MPQVFLQNQRRASGRVATDGCIYSMSGHYPQYACHMEKYLRIQLRVVVASYHGSIQLDLRFGETALFRRPPGTKPSNPELFKSRAI